MIELCIILFQENRRLQNGKYIHCIYIFLIIFLSSASFAYAEDTDFTIRNDDTNKANLTQIIESVLESQENILIDIEEERKKHQDLLRD